MKQVVRIIGGQFRGKKLHVPILPGLRPTASRIRETLFNWLMPYIRESRCLDAFAGSGVLGFEAISRGAREVVMVERAAQAYMNLQKQANSFGSTAITVIKADIEDYLQQPNKPFDIIFLDPPFGENLLDTCIHLIKKHNLLSNDGLLYLESDKEIVINHNIWQMLKSKKAGQVYYSLYIVKSLEDKALV